MKHLIKILLVISLLIPQAIFAAIDFDVTPIKYELEADPGDSIVLPATLINK